MQGGTGTTRLVCVALWALAIGAAVFITGCGAAATSDPFVGSWSTSDHDPVAAVISPTSDGYRVAVVVDGRTIYTEPLTRHGDWLETDADWKAPNGHTSWYRIVVRHTGREQISWNAGDVTIPLLRVSDSITFPSAMPASEQGFQSPSPSGK